MGKVSEPTPFGTLRFAENYRVAADRVIGDSNSLKRELLMPAYNLIAQSIELSLKAYLLATGISAKELSGNVYGHKLGALLDKSECVGLGVLVPIDELERQIISTLGVSYATHQFRYIRVGYKTLPFWSETARTAKKLTYGLHDFCLALRLGESEARQRIETSGKF